MGRNDNKRIAAVQDAIKASGVSPIAVAQIVIDSILALETDAEFNLILNATINKATEIQRQIDEVDETETDRAEKVAAALNAKTDEEAERLCGFLSADDAQTVMGLRTVAKNLLPPGERPWEKADDDHKVRKTGKMGGLRAAMKQQESEECDCPACTAQKAGTYLIKPRTVGEA